MASQIALRWGFVAQEAPQSGSDYSLYLTDERLELRSTGLRSSGIRSTRIPSTESSQGPVFVDFTQGAVNFRRRFGGGRKQLIARAAGLKKGATPTVLDATAGFARDAFVLACLGCEVTLIERSPIIAALLEDGIKRALSDTDIGDLVQDKFCLLYGDAINIVNELQEDNYPDVIYLDPMFPERVKSALVKKEMRVFRDLVGKDMDSDKLISVALEKAKKRVVVKRPVYAPWLNQLKPSIEMKGKKHRFDVYLTSY